MRSKANSQEISSAISQAPIKCCQSKSLSWGVRQAWKAFSGLWTGGNTLASPEMQGCFTGSTIIHIA